MAPLGLSEADRTNLHHSRTADQCDLCSHKLKDAHDVLVDWFFRVKREHPSVHVSCTYRDKASQDMAVKEGRSKLAWPKSAHNKLPAEALDLFEVNEYGGARFDPGLMAKIAAQAAQENEPIFWGGNFKTLGDFVHFQLKQDWGQDG